MIGNLKTYLALATILAVLGSVTWHKHVVHDRDRWHASADAYKKDRDAALKAVDLSEQARKKEATAAREDAAKARTNADTRVAEARRAATVIKRIVEKPHAQAASPTAGPPGGSCSVTDLVPAGELRDALQPRPFGPAGEAAPVFVPDAPERAAHP